MQTDETDQALLALLAQNARSPVATLARRLGLARTTVQARIDRLEARGVIAGYTLKLGAGSQASIRATVLISVEPRSQPEVLARLKSLPLVEHVSTTSGRFDLIATLTAPSTDALDETLDRITEARGVKGSESLIHLSTKIDRLP
ncbi:Lrp/AsnC family transcriptional regulator [Alisedimentitalea sp. MJ-SS2]|uniref:Lrp/AsnC family transcriptional regulator n=1 Tax=Aliisedimentitalea sp. MJ-SS2 TaxID=3049795 RepID=UPI0029137079|nr:Lrp/AsnC family transcriptional regulator [Alisedimentitalea sp. MJ-SS2]MDU8928420.1 Lrp/AsnC family transcriptional regulator [Alisedimentitalea sp. MJ-SS2]